MWPRVTLSSEIVIHLRPAVRAALRAASLFPIPKQLCAA
jgi:hypothetical protein